ncbi:hypothetical protein SO694_00026060 [Aureococcus anophagefferens]|uniref:Zinc finger C2H2 LYAR-type domain-containing protein n=1 Tax=Aureococcus anophagefferens TaxID=44056 RepID=A0ABR1FUQ5_AURAN
MVFFVCEDCNETLKRLKVAAHLCKCSCSAITCVDCNKSFYDDSYLQHSTCMSEAERYEGHLYQAPKKRSAQDASLAPLLPRLAALDNVPRNEKKFKNFVGNSLNLRDAARRALWAYRPPRARAAKAADAAAAAAPAADAAAPAKASEPEKEAPAAAAAAPEKAPAPEKASEADAKAAKKARKAAKKAAKEAAAAEEAAAPAEKRAADDDDEATARAEKKARKKARKAAREAATDPPGSPLEKKKANKAKREAA